MIEELVNLYMSTPNSANRVHSCKFCCRSFVKESTLLSHACEGKRRDQQRSEVGVQIGFKVYIRFYELTQHSKIAKTYEDFASSAYYTAFVKFGRYCVSVRIINVPSYSDWLLRNNKRIDDWCKDSLYEEWMYSYLQKEAVQDALERGLKEMTDYAETHTELKNGFSEYFKFGNANRICYHISTGRISPWVVYNCDSGIKFLDSLNEDQINLIIKWIDPDFWGRKFKDYDEDVCWVKEVLQAAQL